MAFMAGNLSLRASVQLRRGILSLDRASSYEIAGTFRVYAPSYGEAIHFRMKKASFITAMKARDYNSSSGLFRYIPKKSSTNDEPDSSPSKNGSKRDGFHNFSDSASRRGDSNNGGVVQKRIHFDGKFVNHNQTQSENWFSSNDAKQGMEDKFDHYFGSIDEDLIEEAEELVEDLNLSYKEDSFGKKPSKGCGSMQEAEQLAITLLAARALTAIELRKKLHRKKFSPSIVDKLIEDFQTRGLIDDNLYAENFSRSRWSSSTWGPRRIKQALLKKGIKEFDAEKAVQQVFEDDGEAAGNERLRVGLSKQSMDHLLVQASKQWARGRADVPKEKRKARIVRWLQYRGFNWDVISSVLKKLESS